MHTQKSEGARTFLVRIAIACGAVLSTNAGSSELCKLDHGACLVHINVCKLIDIYRISLSHPGLIIYNAFNWRKKVLLSFNTCHWIADTCIGRISMPKFELIKTNEQFWALNQGNHADVFQLYLCIENSILQWAIMRLPWGAFHSLSALFRPDSGTSLSLS